MKVANLLADLTTLNLAPIDAAQSLVAQRPGKSAGELDGADAARDGPDVARARTLLSLDRMFKQEFGSDSKSNGLVGSRVAHNASAKESLEEARASVRKALPKLEDLGYRGKQEQQTGKEDTLTNQRASSRPTKGKEMQPSTQVDHDDEDAGLEDDELEAWS